MVGRFVNFVLCSRLTVLPVRLKPWEKFRGNVKTALRTHSNNVNFSTTAKRGRRKSKTAEETLEQNEVNEPPKLIYPFTSSTVNINSCTNNIKNVSNTLDDNAPLNMATEFSNKQSSSDDLTDTFLAKEDSIEGRYYLFRTPDEDQYRLPSVTTVLQSTKPNSLSFGLHNWRKSMIEEHGEQGYKQIRKDIIKNGTLFHQVRTINNL